MKEKTKEQADFLSKKHQNFKNTLSIKNQLVNTFGQLRNCFPSKLIQILEKYKNITPKNISLTFGLTVFLLAWDVWLSKTSFKNFFFSSSGNLPISSEIYNKEQNNFWAANNSFFYLESETKKSEKTLNYNRNQLAFWKEIKNNGKDFYYKRKYDTIAHDRLDIEKKSWTPQEAYKILDEIIKEAKNKIQYKPSYSEEEIEHIFETVDSILKEKWFENEWGSLLGQGLVEKRLDCDRYSFIYLAIAEEMNLPMRAVYVPSHMFVRWDETKENSNYETDKNWNIKERNINWETMLSKTITDEKYVERYDISELNLGGKENNYMDSLNKKQTQAFSYQAAGNAFARADKDAKAINMYGKAIELNPHICITYSNKASLLEGKKIAKALSLYNKAIDINPNNSVYYYKAANILKEKEDSEKVIQNFTIVIEKEKNGPILGTDFPYLSEAYLKRGIVFKEIGEFSKALDDFRQASVQDFGNPLPYKYRAEIYELLGEYENAEKYFQTYKRLSNFSE